MKSVWYFWTIVFHKGFSSRSDTTAWTTLNQAFWVVNSASSGNYIYMGFLKEKDRIVLL
jgi:hypothetical protein